MNLKTTKSVSIKFKIGIFKQAQEFAEKEGMTIDRYVENAVKRHLSNYKTVNVLVSEPKRVKPIKTVFKIIKSRNNIKRNK